MSRENTNDKHTEMEHRVHDVTRRIASNRAQHCFRVNMYREYRHMYNIFSYELISLINNIILGFVYSQHLI